MSGSYRSGQHTPASAPSTPRATPATWGQPSQHALQRPSPGTPSASSPSPALPSGVLPSASGVYPIRAQQAQQPAARAGAGGGQPMGWPSASSSVYSAGAALGATSPAPGPAPGMSASAHTVGASAAQMPAPRPGPGGVAGPPPASVNPWGSNSGGSGGGALGASDVNPWGSAQARPAVAAAAHSGQPAPGATAASAAPPQGSAPSKTPAGHGPLDPVPSAGRAEPGAWSGGWGSKQKSSDSGISAAGRREGGTGGDLLGAAWPGIGDGSAEGAEAGGLGGDDMGALKGTGALDSFEGVL